LYRDVLTSVLAFLLLGELAAAMAVNKEWAAAVLSMRSAMLLADIGRYAELNGLLSSRMRHHVGQLSQTDAFDEPTLSLSSNDLLMVSIALPQLRSLSARLSVGPGVSPLEFPAQLQQLSMSLDHSRHDASRTKTTLLSSIGRLEQLHTLHLWIPQRAPVSLVALQQLPLLRDFYLSMWFRDSEVQLATELRALPWLHRLRIDSPSNFSQEARVALWNALLAEAPEEQLRTLQWRDFTIVDFAFTDELTPLLSRLPLLEHLQAEFARCSRFDFLAALPHLTHLELRLWSMNDDAWGSLLGVFISNVLARLETLVLQGGPCNSDDLKKLLSHTPLLTSLTLCLLDEVSTLSLFGQLPQLVQTLMQLTLECRRSWRLTAADLPHLLALQQLRTLRLLNWPSEKANRLTVADRAPFEQRPCAVLPHLEEFEWTA
jgi:hypothetical protein